jgi:hypothetical protein
MVSSTSNAVVGEHINFNWDTKSVPSEKIVKIEVETVDEKGKMRRYVIDRDETLNILLLRETYYMGLE